MIEVEAAKNAKEKRWKSIFKFAILAQDKYITSWHCM
jgi:hypothetical protein